MELKMSVSNIKGFLSWQFRGNLKNPSFYGVVISVLGLVAAVAGCPAPWPMIMNIGGVVIVMIDLAYSWIKYSYQLYRMEQDRIVRELARKEQ
jgi:hypothetical protein